MVDGLIAAERSEVARNQCSKQRRHPSALLARVSASGLS